MGHKLILLALLIAPFSLAQVPADEAAARLRERAAARAVAASKPSTMTQAEADGLRQQVRILKAQLAEAQAQIALLRADLEKAKTPPAKQVDGKPVAKEPEGSLTADGPGVYRFTFHSDFQPLLAPPAEENIKARSRAIAIDIALRKGVPLTKKYDADGNEQVVNCRKVKDLSDEELK